MTNIKTLLLAAGAVLSLGIGSAMAQESPGGADVDSHPAFPSPVMHRSVVTTYEWRTVPVPTYTYHYWAPAYDGERLPPDNG